MRRLLAHLAVYFCTSQHLAGAAEVQLRGLVHEQDTGRPVAGAVLQVSNGTTEVRVVSDADGRYHCSLAPGIVSGHVMEVPAPFAKPRRAFRAPIELRGDAQEFSLPTIDLRRGRTVQGRVVDDDGKPVAGIAVETGWRAVLEPWAESYVAGPKWRITRTDEHGKFTFRGVDPVPDPRLAKRGPRFWAAGNDRATESSASLPPNPDNPVELRLSRKESVSLSGRVVDVQGNAVAGARIEVWTQWRDDDGFIFGQVPLFASAEDILSDAEGRFRTPRHFGREAEYSLMASCEGFLPAGGTWFRPGDGAVAGAPELTLRRLRTVRGRVVDRQHRPLAGARVFQSGDGVERTAATSGDDGRFALAGVAEGPAFVFADLHGYRFAGQSVDESDETEIMLARADEAVAALASLPANVLPREEELAIARRVIELDVEQALRSTSHDERWDAIFYSLRLDPIAALERLDGGALPDLSGDERDVLRTRIARALVHDDPDEAEADETRFYGPQTAAVAAAILLPVFETIDPKLVGEYFWRAVSFRRRYVQGDQEDLFAELGTLALLLARYDRAAARVVLAPVAEALERRAVNETGLVPIAAVYAACAIDPHWAARLVERRPGDETVFRLSWRNHLAWAFGMRPAVRTRLLLGNYLGYAYWLPGGPDNEFQVEF